MVSLRVTVEVGLLLALSVAASSAASGQVRVLEDGGTYVVVGTDDFSLRIDRSGAIGPIMVGDTEWSWLIRLYTTPISFETGKPIRAVQGESGRGLGPLPDTVQAQQRGECVSVVIVRQAAREEIRGGAALYQLTETVTVHPGGLINLRYEFDWRRFLRMHRADLVIALRAAPLDGCPWWADFTSHVLHGTISADPDIHSLAGIKGDMRTFTVDCGEGDLQLWINEGDDVTVQRWNPKDYAFFLHVPHTGYLAELYPGVRSVLDVDIVLPLSRED